MSINYSMVNVGFPVYLGGKWSQWIRMGSPELNLKHKLYHSIYRPFGKKPLVVLVPCMIQDYNRKTVRLENLEMVPSKEEIENQIRMIRVARRFPEYEFIYRVFPYKEKYPNPAVLEALKQGSNCRVFRHGNLFWLMKQAAHVFLTHYMTAFWEAQQCEARIVLLVNRETVKLPDEMMAYAKRAALVAETPETFERFMYYRLASFLPDDYFSRRMVNR